MIIQGRAWVLGDNVDTDVIVPGQFLASPVEEAAPHALEAVLPDFAGNVKPGDVIVAGRNFGCGSSREIAPQALKHLGVGCILARDFARIFFRNAIAIGLPALALREDPDAVKQLDELIVDTETGVVRPASGGGEISAFPLPARMWEIIEAGGIDGMLKKIAAR